MYHQKKAVAEVQNSIGKSMLQNKAVPEWALDD